MMKRRDFLIGLGMVAIASQLPLPRLEEDVRFDAEDLRVLAKYSVAKLKEHLSRTRFRRLDFDGRIGDVVRQNYGASFDWSAENTSVVDFREQNLVYVIRAIAERCNEDRVTGFAVPTLPRGFAESQISIAVDDESNVAIRVLKEYDIAKDTFWLRLDVYVSTEEAG